MKPIWLKLATWYAVLTGVLLVFWWTTQLAGVLPEALAPVQLAWSHIAAEMLAAVSPQIADLPSVVVDAVVAKAYPAAGRLDDSRNGCQECRLA